MMTTTKTRWNTSANTHATAGLRLCRRSRVEGASERYMVVPVGRVRLGVCRVQPVMQSMLGTNAVRILVEGGFIQAEQRGGKREICMVSLMQHLVAATDPGFWDAEKTARYLAARQNVISRRRGGAAVVSSRSE